MFAFLLFYSLVYVNYKLVDGRGEAPNHSLTAGGVGNKTSDKLRFRNSLKLTRPRCSTNILQDPRKEKLNLTLVKRVFSTALSKFSIITNSLLLPFFFYLYRNICIINDGVSKRRIPNVASLQITRAKLSNYPKCGMFCFYFCFFWLKKIFDEER